MEKQNILLSREQLQAIFEKLQILNADFICFEEFQFGYSIVNFKQKQGDIYMSGSILVNEIGEIVPITLSSGKKYDGLECLRSETEGSSLLQLNRVIDINSVPTKYIHYGIDIHEISNGRLYWHREEGIVDTESKRCVNLKGSLIGIQAKIWTEDVMCISCLVHDKRKYGVMRKCWNGWVWLIRANFAYIDYKDGEIFTYDENDISVGRGHLYEKELKSYKITDNIGKKIVTGSIIKSTDDLIRNGYYAGYLFSDISLHMYEKKLKTRLFIIDDALTETTDDFRAIRDSDIIEKELVIYDKDQLVDFNISEYIDDEGNILNVNSLISGNSFEEAFLNHYTYVDTLIKHQKIKVKERVYNAMLLEEYANSDSQEIRERLITAKDSIYNNLSQSQIKDVFETIGIKSFEEFDAIDVKLNGNVYIVHYFTDGFGGIEYNFGECEHYFVVSKEGEIFCKGCTLVRYISDDIILYEKNYLETVWNEEKWDNPKDGPRHNDYHMDYLKIEEQGIINYKGEVIYKGDLGNLDLASMKSQYLLLEKPKFTPLEKDKINYYLAEYVSEEEDCCECSECGGKAYWEEYKECYVCEDCDNHIQGKHDDCKMTKSQMLAADNFEDVLSSETVSQGQFITETEEERYRREEWEENLAFEPEEDYLEVEEWEENLALEPEEDYLEGNMYALFSISKKTTLIPYQKCKILIYNPEKPEIYLVDEQKEGGVEVGISIPFNPKLKKGEWMIAWSYWNGKEYFTLRGTVFDTIFDTFRYGPLTGMTLSLAFKKKYQLLVKYIQNSSIFITSIAMKQLYQKYNNECPKKIEEIIMYRDLLFEYEDIGENTDLIKGKAAYFGIVSFSLDGKDKRYNPKVDDAWHNGETFIDVLQKSPQYIVQLIKNNRIRVSQNVLSKIDEKLPIYKDLKNAFDIQKRIIEEENERDYYELMSMKEEALGMEYEIDTWNAMTDGQYGDMPEGFDGDYDFLGY